MTLRLIAIVAVLLASIAPPLAAQSIADEDRILEAIIRYHLDERQTSGPIKIELQPRRCQGNA